MKSRAAGLRGASTPTAALENGAIRPDTPPGASRRRLSGRFEGESASISGAVDAARIRLLLDRLRLSSEAKWPAQIQDVNAVIRFLRANSGPLKLDPNRFGVIGVSAASHLAAMLGTTGDVTLWDSPTIPNAGVPSRVQAVVAQFGPMVFGQMDAQGTTHNAGLVYRSPGQVNGHPPTGLATGEATPTLSRGGTTLFEDEVQVVSSAPTLFVQMVDGLLRPVGEIGLGPFWVWKTQRGKSDRA